ncbi:MAG: hypothetical protein EA369_03675 [Bradymonadales bacterium]|nr:MAG: hypothetical protein EA369_03675 [Bradymonadales bacterium]
MKRNLLACGLLILAACSKGGDGGRHFFDPIRGESPYESLYRSQTQERSVSSNFDIVLQANVTHWNARLREAYVEEMTRSFRLSESEQNALALEQLAEEESYVVFILTAMTRDARLNDFHRPNSSWRLSLEDESGDLRVSPTRIERFSSREESQRHFFPSMSRFGETYRIQFPKYEFKEVDHLILYISGPYGSLRYSFQGDQSAPSLRFLEVQ